jgi:predicted TIM-barrel fold metal-dependent hydrolase
MKAVTNPVRHVTELGIETIDADGHIKEPNDIWQRYLPEQFRQDAVQIVTLPDGRERYRIDGVVPEWRAMEQIKTIGDMSVARGFDQDNQLGRAYENGLKGGFDPAARIEALDLESIGRAVLYPSRMLLGQNSRNMELNIATCRAYNQYLADFCSHAPERLLHAAVLPFGSVEASIAEMKLAREQHRSVAVMIHPNPYGGKPVADSANEPFWAAAEGLGMPVALHIAPLAWKLPNPNLGVHGVEWLPEQRWALASAIYPTDQLLGFTALVAGGVMERYPRLRFAFFEGGSAWLADYLDRADHVFKEEGWLSDVKLSLKPSEYFRRQCWISSDLDEKLLPALVEAVGADRIMWSSDYPHPECRFPNSFDEIMEREDINDDVRRAVLHDAARSFYGLS